MVTAHRVLGALSALSLFLPSMYAAEAGNESGVAVIIGNKAYQDQDVPAVDYAHNDADAFREFVVGLRGFSLDNVVDLRDATKVQMEGAFGTKGNAKGHLWRRAKKDGSSDVVVFYSGHGVPGINDGRGYLLPVDANLDMAEINGYPIDVLYENLGKVPAKSVTVFLDACFSGGSGGGQLIRGYSPVYVEADVAGVDGLTVLTAASSKQVAIWDAEARHGLFTEHLLEGLYGAADADSDGGVSAAEAKRYLDEHMTPAARRIRGREQDAGLHGDESAVLSFASPSGWSSRPLLGPPLPTDPNATPPRPGSRMDPAEAAWRQIETINDVRILERFVRKFPGSPFRLAAEARIAALRGASFTVRVEPPSARKVEVRLRVGERFHDCPECPEMVVVPAGSFLMGSRESEKGRDGAEGPVHRVSFSAPFALGVYEVTFAQWDACESGGGCGGLSPDDWGWGRGRRPVINVSWEDAQAYVRWLSAKTGKRYRLPSESEWEYAARAGTRTPFHTGATISTEQAHHNHQRTVTVGTFPANDWGLHDLHGNVQEWTEDCWTSSYEGALADGSAWQSRDCSRRVLRGGAWIDGPGDLRSASRSKDAPAARFSNNGFRVVRTLTP